MSITRVFRVQIDTELREEFEEKFADISVSTVQQAAGMISVSILKPTKWSPDEYAMITQWIDEESLKSFAGNNWNRAIIPIGMEKFVEKCSVEHYLSWD